jgi:hypothetical protein
MKSWTWQVALFSGLILGGQAAQAAQVSLADWCVNVNGDTSTACNGAGSGGTTIDGSSVSLANLDLTLEPSSNTLGSVTVTLNNAPNQYVSFYSDYDVAYGLYGSFDDSISVQGALPGGVSYSAKDPSSSGASLPTGFTLFDQFSNNNLDNTNSVGVPSGPPGECCDAAWAMALSGINGSGTVTFTVSDTAPGSGFYLQQTNTDTQGSIYLSVSSAIVSGPSGVPEPSTFALGLGAIGMALAAARAKRSRA